MKLSLFADDMIVYIQNPIDSTKKLLYLINEFGKTAGYKVNTHKSKAFLYTNNETAETKIMKKVPFDIATRKIKYLGINLIKEVNDLHSENYATLKKLRKIQTNGSMYHVHGLEELTSSKCPYHKAIYRFNTTLIKVLMMCLIDIEQTFQKFIWNHKRP